MTISLEPLPRDECARAAHIELGADQTDFVGRVPEMMEIASPLEDFHVILRANTVVGFFKIDRGYADGYPFAAEGEIGLRGLVVDHKLQGQGIGAAAMAMVPPYVAEHYSQAHSLLLTVNCRNTVAKLTYERAGFQLDDGLYLGGPSGPQHILRYPLLEASTGPV